MMFSPTSHMSKRRVNWVQVFNASRFTQSTLLLARSLRRARFRDSNSRRSGIDDAPFGIAGIWEN
jgi:hypothetical protein